MGCYNQACNISGLDIRRTDKCVIIPILPNEKSESSNDRCFRYFKPFCLPITGRYDDYGSIEKIVKDINTEAIEKYFEISIEQFVECVTTRRDDDFYGEYAPIQSAYGKTNVSVRESDLTTIGFITHTDRTVTHPILESVQKYLSEITWGKVDFTPIKIHWDKDDNLIVSGIYDKPETFKAKEDATGYNDFLNVIHRGYDNLNKKAWMWNRPFIFGIPQDKQKRAHLLNKLHPSFVRHDVYKAISKKAAKMCDRGEKRATERHEEYVELVNKYISDKERYKILHARFMAKLPETKIEEHERGCLYFSVNESHEMLRHPRISCFDATRHCKDFRGIYDNLLLNEEIIKRLDEFEMIEYAMIILNILLIDTDGMQQHGDLKEQLQFIQTIESVAKKAIKNRDW